MTLHLRSFIKNLYNLTKKYSLNDINAYNYNSLVLPVSFKRNPLDFKRSLQPSLLNSLRGILSSSCSASFNKTSSGGAP